MDLAFEKPFRPVRVAKQGLVVSDYCDDWLIWVWKIYLSTMP
jgi:hypothetical protein